MTSYFKNVDWKSANSIALFWVSCDLFKKDFNITSPADNAVALSLSLSLFCSVDAVAFWDKEMGEGGAKYLNLRTTIRLSVFIVLGG